MSYIHPDGLSWALYGVNIVNTRANLLGASDVLEGAALDKYSFVRNAYLQRRNYLLSQGKGGGNAALPDYGDNAPLPKYDDVDGSAAAAAGAAGGALAATAGAAARAGRRGGAQGASARHRRDCDAGLRHRSDAAARYERRPGERSGPGRPDRAAAA